MTKLNNYNFARRPRTTAIDQCRSKVRWPMCLCKTTHIAATVCDVVDAPQISVADKKTNQTYTSRRLCDRCSCKSQNRQVATLYSVHCESEPTSDDRPFTYKKQRMCIMLMQLNPCEVQHSKCTARSIFVHRLNNPSKNYGVKTKNTNAIYTCPIAAPPV